jgi:hypothetical protein
LVGIINDDYGVFERISQINIDYKWNVYIRINARIRVLVHINLINTDIYLLNVNSYIVYRSTVVGWLGGWVVYNKSIFIFYKIDFNNYTGSLNR